jgi:predicted nuclease of predicted toxin-antitoxin system
MRFLLDENAEYRIAAVLGGMGHDVTAVAHEYPSGISDLEVLGIAVAEDRILITNDSDFGDLVFRQHFSHAGILYLRIPQDTSIEEKIGLLLQGLETHQDLLHRFLVVTNRGVRVR